MRNYINVVAHTLIVLMCHLKPMILLFQLAKIYPNANIDTKYKIIFQCFKDLYIPTKNGNTTSYSLYIVI